MGRRVVSRYLSQRYLPQRTGPLSRSRFVAAIFAPLRISFVAHFRRWRLVKMSSIFTHAVSKRLLATRISCVFCTAKRACLGSQRACAGLGNGQRPFCRRGKRESESGGKVREERRAFRRRIIRILLFEDENLFLSFVTATV